MTAADREPPGPPGPPEMPEMPPGLPEMPPGLREMPPGLRERVLAASLRARDAGRPVPDAPEISAVEAFGRAANAF